MLFGISVDSPVALASTRTYHLLTARPMPAQLSIVVPIYNEVEVLPLLAARLTKLMAELACPVQVIFVNDGSTDESVLVLQSIALADARFLVLCLARNFGHQAAATAGLDAATGDAVVLMDADLQDPPELIHQMLTQYCAGYDVVYARRQARDGETIFKKASAWIFYRLMRVLVYPDLPADTGDFRLVSRRCLQALSAMRETHRFLRGMVSWVGFPQTAVLYTRQARAAGSTKYPLHKMLRFAWTAAVSFSPAPLRLSTYLGTLLFGIGVADGIYAVGRLVLGLYNVPGWTSVIVLECISGGAIMMAIGLLGEYVARIYEESKGRPLYIVSDRIEASQHDTRSRHSHA